MNRVEAREDNLEDRAKPLRSSMSRRSFLGTSLAVGAGTIGAGLLVNAPTARGSGGLTRNDEAILRFLAAAEIIETDLWQDRKSTRLNSSHQIISYAVFCLK